MYSSSVQVSAVSQRAYETQKVGLTCLVPEARGTVVVKIYNVAPKHGKKVFDLAARWINDTTASQTFALAKILGLEAMIQNIDGDELMENRWKKSERPLDGGLLVVGTLRLTVWHDSADLTG